MYINVLLKSNMHIPTYAGLFNLRVSFILCTATRFLLNILELTNVGLDVNLVN